MTELMKSDIVTGGVSLRWMLVCCDLVCKWIEGEREVSWRLERLELGVVGCNDGDVGILKERKDNAGSQCFVGKKVLCAGTWRLCIPTRGQCVERSANMEGERMVSLLTESFSPMLVYMGDVPIERGRFRDRNEMAAWRFSRSAKSAMIRFFGECEDLEAPHRESRFRVQTRAFLRTSSQTIAQQSSDKLR